MDNNKTRSRAASAPNGVVGGRHAGRDNVALRRLVSADYPSRLSTFLVICSTWESRAARP
jgi:hypothetical protein